MGSSNCGSSRLSADHGALAADGVQISALGIQPERNNNNRHTS
jgi:hypothetical protein